MEVSSMFFSDFDKRKNDGLLEGRIIWFWYRQGPLIPFIEIISYLTGWKRRYHPAIVKAT
jgi:hypothetical protein